MQHRFPQLRPPVETPRKASARATIPLGFTLADLCLTAALVLSVALAVF
ncbi:MAG: hypothetical protein ACKO2N_01165 [Tabrizicola sp.]